MDLKLQHEASSVIEGEDVKIILIIGVFSIIEGYDAFCA